VVNNTGIDLNLLFVFRALLDERSVTRASAKVGLSQPALSNALARLRLQFGNPLFVRGRNGMQPTPRALELAPHIEAAFEHILAAVGSPSFQPATLTRTFRVATTDEIEMSLLPALVRQVQTAAPGITIACKRLQGLFELPDAELQSGALDFALGTLPHPPRVESGFYAQPLYEEEHVCIARRNHPDIGTRLTLKQYTTLKHAVTFYPGEGPGLFDKVLSQRGQKRIVGVSVPHCLSVPFVVAKSDMIATVTRVTAGTFGPLLKLRTLPCPINIPRLKVSLMWHSRAQEDLAHRWLRGVIVDVNGELLRRAKRHNKGTT
jgi:DNA-binding transcriptional LysR family regulator